MSEPHVVSVALQRPLPPLSYSVPEELRDEIFPGALVEVPLSKGSEIGCVISGVSQGDLSEALFELKDITRRVSPDYVIDDPIMKLAQWVSDYYLCSIGEALCTASMLGFSDVSPPKKKSHWEVPEGFDEAALTEKQCAVRRRLIDVVGASAAASQSELAKLGETTAAVIKRLIEAGAIVPCEPIVPLPPPDSVPALLPQQQAACEAISASLDAFAVFLLFGVTGSGKTEVYLRLIGEVLARGGSAICLVPEISLTPQTVERFSRRFQQEVGVFHSQLTKSEKLSLYQRLREGKVRLVIGARSAIFAPVRNLGLIVVDEEHEGSYKQGETPRYHARDTAIMRAKLSGIPVVLGSATPSMESYSNALAGKYTLLELHARPMGLAMPEVRIISMGKAAAHQAEAATLISEELRDAIALRLARGEQSLLFLNRRGFSNFLFCPACRWVARCNDDDITLTIHRRGAARKREETTILDLFPEPLDAAEAWLKCHFCGRTSSFPKGCPNCGEKDLLSVGSGTQRVEESLKALFPGEPILRLDQDTISGRRSFLEAWRQMVTGEAKIILGTQMIAKGLHLEGVTLVGVVLADVGLFIPDFRAEERTFCLLMQVAGRAGRTAMGEVLIQTYMPHHAAIQLAARHDYKAFYETESKRRHHLRFPPVERLIALTLSDPDLARSKTWARNLGELLTREAARRDGNRRAILGPQAAPVERLGGRFRQRLLVRGSRTADNARLLRRALASADWNPPASLRLTIDVDPIDLF